MGHWLYFEPSGHNDNRIATLRRALRRCASRCSASWRNAMLHFALCRSAPPRLATQRLMRREFSKRTKDLAADRANGHCESCGRQLLHRGDYHFDHTIPDGLTGEPTLENIQVLCKSCHRDKTKKDVGVIAKAKRNRRKARGIKDKSRFACSRDSRWKKKLTGEIVPR